VGFRIERSSSALGAAAAGADGTSGIEEIASARGISIARGNASEENGGGGSGGSRS
jgi:hypothetical protein